MTVCDRCQGTGIWYVAYDEAFPDEDYRRFGCPDCGATVSPTSVADQPEHDPSGSVVAE